MSLRALAATIRLHIPTSRRRRLRDAQQLAFRLHLGNLRLANANNNLTNTLIRSEKVIRDATAVLNEATEMISALRGELRIVEGALNRRTAERDAARSRVEELEEMLDDPARKLGAAVDALPKVPTQRDRSQQ